MGLDPIQRADRP